ncbi:MAG: tetratricopeptide repeat protein, partial [Limisphaerales bacterium]
MVVLVATCGLTHAAGTNDITSLVQSGLFEEEANHNLDAAMQSYETAIKLHDKDRKLAATAIFRLGECYRKQGKTEEANKQYQRILAEFRDQTQLVDVSRNYLPSKPNKTTPPSAQPTEDAALIGQLRSLSVDTAQAEGLWKSANRLQLEDRIKFFTSIQPDQ